MVIVIFIFAAALRLLKLSQLPPGLYLDEVLYGLDAYSILKTGKDIYGHFLPLAFQSSGHYPPLFIYLLAPLFLFLPLTDWVVRLPAALSGIAAVLMTYFMTKKLFTTKIAVLSCLFLTFLPWHIHLSRVAFLGSFGIAFLILASYLFLQNHITLSLAVFALSTHIHYGYKLLAPTLFVVLLWLHRKRINFIDYLIIAATIISHFISIRYYNALFRVTALSLTQLPQMISEYLKAFSPQFLFIKGDPNLLLNPWGRGQLPLIFIPLLILGLWQLFKFRFPTRALILTWLFLAPIPSALAGQGDHAVRNSPMIIPLVIIAALGLRRFPILAVLIIIHSLSFLSFYTRDYPAMAASLWGPPARQITHTIPDKFYVYLSYYAFINQLPPQTLQQAIVTRRIGNLYFADE